MSMTPERWSSQPGAMKVPASTVPGFVEAGLTVWSYGYGDTEGEYTSVDTGDMWAFVGPDADAGVVASWAPFIIFFDEAMHVNCHGEESDPDCTFCRSTYDPA